ncbi:MAG: carbohydrate binding family 9 domain-containing protein, partial [Lewinella sp.]|nr:carbohydrate binding family 9 domain-containing protein [Lewinella sp.]
MYKLLLTALLGAGLYAVLWGQPGTEPLSIRAHLVATPPVIDGIPDETVWEEVAPATNFWQHLPYDTLIAEGQTEVRMVYDAEYLYVAVKCHRINDQMSVESLRRDYSFGNNDNITLVFDTYNDQTNAFVFGINPYGVRREALIANGGRITDDFNSAWDNKWRGEARIFPTF